MEPFATISEAQEWMDTHASGTISVYVGRIRMTIALRGETEHDEEEE